MKENCKKCGFWKGLHAAGSNRCPIDDRETGEYLENQTYEAMSNRIDELTIRDFFAGCAIVSMASNMSSISYDANPEKRLATIAYEIADAMIKERGNQ